MAVYITKFKVKGHGAFPVDMLRYDRCFPDTSGDAMNISLSLARESEAHEKTNMATKDQVVTLKREHVGKKSFKPTEGRWSSFGWRVIESETYSR